MSQIRSDLGLVDRTNPKYRWPWEEPPLCECGALRDAGWEYHTLWCECVRPPSERQRPNLQPDTQADIG